MSIAGVEPRTGMEDRQIERAPGGKVLEVQVSAEHAWRPRALHWRTDRRPGDRQRRRDAHGAHERPDLRADAGGEQRDLATSNLGGAYELACARRNRIGGQGTRITRSQDAAGRSRVVDAVR